ncbi:restriction endonuclease subunit S [Mammaliicoccus sciuri]|uniref:restriction endonuclease subunit S n=1 Tax=Mammaliicoccus sciuri TaxID=1296 RepID=UPI003A8FDA2B
MTNELKNVPELRFPEFDGEWEENKLIDVLKDKSEGIKRGPFGGALKKDIFIEDGYAIYEQRNAIYDMQQFRYFITQQKYDEMIGFAIKPNDIIMSCSGTIGKLSLIPENAKQGIINQALIRFRTNDKLLSNYFLIYMNSQYMQRKILESNPGSAITNLIPVKELKKLNFPSPKINEQQKIGEFFNKLNRQIELEEQKLAKLEEQKKGYMQKIFSQELRFKDENGNEYPEWEDYVLGEIGFSYTGLSGKTKEDFGHGNASFITYMNVFKNTIANINMTEKVEIKENEKQNKVNYKDILFTTSSEVPEETGMASVWLYEKDNVYLNSFCFGFRVTSHNVNPIYLSRYLRSEKMRKQITLLSQGSTRFNISKKEVLKLNIDVPELREQNKIVEYLSCHDSRIVGQKNKINVLKERKQGLLQKMFI